MGEGRGGTPTGPWNNVLPWPVVHKVVDKLWERY